MFRTFKVIVFSLSLCCAVVATPKQAEASKVPGIAYAFYIGGAALNLTSMVASSYYLGTKKNTPIGWDIFSYTVGGLTFGTGLAMAPATLGRCFLA